MSLLALLPMIAAFADTTRVTFPSGSQSNYEGRTRISVGTNGFEVLRTGRTEGCTAWGIVSDRIMIGHGTKTWSLDFEIYSDRDWYRVETSPQWRNAVVFYRADGTLAETHDLEIEFPARRFLPFRFTGNVPSEAVAAAVRFGINSNPPRFATSILRPTAQMSGSPNGSPPTSTPRLCEASSVRLRWMPASRCAT